nr:hypothetical protein [Deltaproteobacteria bacterium]
MRKNISIVGETKRSISSAPSERRVPMKIWIWLARTCCCRLIRPPRKRLDGHWSARMSPMSPTARSTVRVGSWSARIQCVTRKGEAVRTVRPDTRPTTAKTVAKVRTRSRMGAAACSGSRAERRASSRLTVGCMPRSSRPITAWSEPKTPTRP